MKEKDNNNQKTLEIQVSRLKECLKESGLSQREIAEKLNYTEQHISYVFTGKRRLTKEMAINLAELFSKGRSFTYYLEMPYCNLNENDKNNPEIIDSINANGDVGLLFDSPNNIDYKYLLGESEYKDSEEIHCAKPNHSNVDVSFCKSLLLILKRNGYVLDCNSSFEYNAILKAISNGVVFPSHNKPNSDIKLTNEKTGESYTIKPTDLYLYFSECENLLMSLTDSFFQRLKLEANFNKGNQCKNLPKPDIDQLCNSPKMSK